MELSAESDLRASPSSPATRLQRRRPAFTLAVGTGIILGLLLAGYVAPLPYSPVNPNVNAILVHPGSAHWFGTDASGFDLFSRTIRAARHDLPLALAGTLLSLLVGAPLGLLAGTRGRTSGALMRALDIFQAFPLLILAIAIVTLTGNDIKNIVLAIAIVNVPRFIRLIRSEVLVLRDSRFIEAAEVVGCSPRRIMFRHMLPNVVGIVLAQASLATASAIIVIAALNFVGVGVAPPEPTWGSMIKIGSESIAQGQWWVSLFPSAAVFLVIFAFNMIADALEEHFGGR